VLVAVIVTVAGAGGIAGAE
jgi:hypothetical protein